MTYAEAIELAKTRVRPFKRIRTSGRYCKPEYMEVPIKGYNKRVRRIADKYFDDLYRQVDERDKVCVRCGSDKNLTHHHLDGNKENMGLDNIALRCWNCHRREHKEYTGVKQREGDHD